MRAGVLSDEEIIAFLNENFINTWVPNVELGGIPSMREAVAKMCLREGIINNTDHALAKAIIKGWKTGTKKGSPVDCFVISPDFQLMGRQLVNDLEDDRRNKGLPSEESYYLAFLNESLEGKQPGLGNIVLSSDNPSQEMSDIFLSPLVDNHKVTLVNIDARSIENGGILTIDILIGREEGYGLFYLFDEDFMIPKEGKIATKSNLAWTCGESGETCQLKYKFVQGQFFKFIATGEWDAEKPYTNAFYANISVEENPNIHSSETHSTGIKIILEREQPSQKVLDIFRAPGHGNQDYNVLSIDTRAFEDGGTLTIDIQVGNQDASGSFDLFDADTKLPTKDIPRDALVSAWDIKPGQKDNIIYRFEKGKIFKLGATGNWFGRKGRINAFQANISVKEN